MKSKQDQVSIESQVAVIVEGVIRYFSEENRAIKLIARYEGLGNHLCTIDKTWSVHGVTVTNKELSFIASQGNRQTMKFSLSFAHLIELAKQWFKEMAAALKAKASNLVEAIIPPEIIFQAGVTEFIPKSQPIRV